MSKMDKRLMIGVDLGGTNVLVGVVDASSKVLGRAKIKTKAADGTDSILRRIEGAVTDAMADAKVKPAGVSGLGIGAPGAIDIRKGMVLNAPNLRWNRFPLAKALAQEVKLPVTVDNDANVACWGEFSAGAGKGCQDMMAVWVGTGIGAGLVLGGRLYHGAFTTAGELGHVVIKADAPLGRRTLENNASRTSITNQLIQLIQANHPSKLGDMVGGDLSAIRSKVLAKAVAEEDALTCQVTAQAAAYVGSAIASAVTLLSLPRVVIGGGFAEAMGKKWLEQVKVAFTDTVFPAELRACKIYASKLGDDAGIVGAAMLARERLQPPEKS